MKSTEDYSKENNFAVRVTNEEVVAALLPLQEHSLPLSNLDLLLPPVDVAVFFCYDKPPATAAAVVVGDLKKGLARVLVSFYAFAGELVVNSIGQPELVYNNQGVGFIEAVADVELRCLDLYNPDDSIEGKLVPKKKHSVLAVQVTFLKCGGLVVACTFDHRIADAYSANLFLVTWAQLAQPTKPTITSLSSQPCFRRSLLSPRRPGCFHRSITDMYVASSNLPPPKIPEPGSASDRLISRIYYITAHDLNRIQSLANANINGMMKRTKLESFSAFLWKIIAASAEGKRVIARMGIVVDGRKRLSNDQVDKEKASLLNSYIGNIISIPYGEKTVEELSEKSLSWVADEVHQFLEAATTEEHFLGLVDWVEAHRPGAGVARIYCGGDGGEEEHDGPAFVVSSGQRFPEAKVDFGWGRPVFGSYHFPWGGVAGYVMPMPSPAENGDWVVYMHLRKRQLEKIECDAANVFKPLTWDYLN